MDDSVITNHMLVPKHEILDDKSKQKVLDDFGLELDQLPKISKDDPAIKAKGLKEGTVLRIARDSATLGTSDYYRVVV